MLYTIPTFKIFHRVKKNFENKSLKKGFNNFNNTFCHVIVTICNKLKKVCSIKSWESIAVVKIYYI